MRQADLVVKLKQQAEAQLGGGGRGDPRPLSEILYEVFILQIEMIFTIFLPGTLPLFLYYV